MRIFLSYLSYLLDRQRGRSGGGESLKRFLRIKMIIYTWVIIRIKMWLKTKVLSMKILMVLKMMAMLLRVMTVRFVEGPGEN